MTPLEPAPSHETATAAPRVEELRELELSWSVPALTLWTGQLSESEGGLRQA